MSDWWAHFWINFTAIGCMFTVGIAVQKLLFASNVKELEELDELRRLQASWDAQWSEALREAHRR